MRNKEFYCTFDTSKYNSMKNVLMTLMVLIGVCPFSLSAQFEITKDSVVNNYLIEHLGKMGVDNNHVLSQLESEYFNAKFQKKRKNFDFSNKRIAFFTGSGGSGYSNKISYFDIEKDRYSHNYSSNFSSIIILNENEKIDSGGFDAIIIYWAKIVRSKNYYIKRLKKESGIQTTP